MVRETRLAYRACATRDRPVVLSLACLVSAVRPALYASGLWSTQSHSDSLATRGTFILASIWCAAHLAGLRHWYRSRARKEAESEQWEMVDDRGTLLGSLGVVLESYQW